MSIPDVSEHGVKLRAVSDILYVRSALKPLSRSIKRAGGLIQFLQSHVQFDELIVPHFYGARPFWRAPNWEQKPRATNSGAMGRHVAKLENARLSAHSTHAFAGFGSRVTRSLEHHGPTDACFAPIGELADGPDMSMLLLGCVDESPGFSTVHVAQQRLGLTQKHLLRFLLRWDFESDGRNRQVIAPESPGCSASFGKFYPHYEGDGNLISGSWDGVTWLFVPSAKRALKTEIEILRTHGRFVDCGRWNCLSCRLRLY